MASYRLDPHEPEPDRLAYSAGRAIERDMIRAAIAEATVNGTVSLELGAELVAAALDVVGAWHANSRHQLIAAVAKLEALVGRP